MCKHVIMFKKNIFIIAIYKILRNHSMNPRDLSIYMYLWISQGSMNPRLRTFDINAYTNKVILKIDKIPVTNNRSDMKF